MDIRRDVFQAIADPTRRAIIDLVAQQSLNLNAIADNFTMSRPAVSQHIKILSECGLIQIRQQGRERLCEARFEQLQQVYDWTGQHRKLWTGRLDKMDTALKGLKAKAGKKKKHKNKKI